MRYFIILLIISLIVSCKSQQQKDLYPVIHLNPDEAGTLKMSDYFDGYKVIHFRDAICNSIEDITEYRDKYFAISKVGMPTRFQVFDKQGKVLYSIGSIGRGPGEYLDAGRDLILDKDSNLVLLNYIECLKYSIDGHLVENQRWLQHPPGIGSPKLFLNDTTLIHYLPSTRQQSFSNSKPKEKNYLLALQPTKYNQKSHFYFPADRLQNYQITPLLYQYRDTCCFYFDADDYLYRISPEGPVPYYQIDKGKHTKLMSFEEFASHKPISAIQMHVLNESDQYIWGEYLFFGRYYIFLHNKATGITQNHKYLHNDFLHTDRESDFFREKYHGMPKHKIQCDPEYLYYFYYPTKFKEMIDYAKSQLSDSEWQEYCQKNPELVRIYQEINEDSNMIIIGYHFK